MQKSYEVVWHIKRGGKLLPPGSHLDLEAAEAQDMLAAGAIRPAQGAEDADPAPAAPGTLADEGQTAGGPTLEDTGGPEDEAGGAEDDQPPVPEKRSASRKK